jgi:hypothetical protein
MLSRFFNGLDAFWREVRLYDGVNIFQDLELTFLQRRAKVTLYTAGTLAFLEVANKLFVTYVVRD